MKRDIITINEDLCDGCGNCITGCPEGALQLIDGKARLVSDLFCDGLGACIGECPVGAITIETREAVPYDELAVIKNIAKQGKGTTIAHLTHLDEHGESGFLKIALDYLKSINFDVSDFTDKKPEPLACGCPGSMSREIKPAAPVHVLKTGGSADQSSALTQWPVQLHLINPAAPFFQDADILIAADCVPFSLPDFHSKLLAGKKLVIFCPKLDDGIDRYRDKLTNLFQTKNIRSVTIAHMEVPCCFGTGKIVEDSMRDAGVNIPLTDITVSIDGKIIKTVVR